MTSISMAVIARHPARIGAALALASLPIHFLLDANASHQLAAIVLTLVAGVYLGFAIQDGRSSILTIEALVALAFCAAAFAGLAMSPWIIPGAYGLHGFWDLAHHRRIRTTMPAWYVPFCAIFDWVFAAGLTAAWTLAR